METLEYRQAYIKMIKKEFEKTLKKVVLETLGLKDLSIELTHPSEEKFGDLTTKTAIKVSRSLGQSPLVIANNLLDNIYKSDLSVSIEKAEIKGPGFINFFLKKEILISEASRIIQEGSRYGQKEVGAGKKIMVEFTDPNPFKEFHIGHLYDNLVGESLCRLLESQGAQVWRVNYQGDVGLHVAKSVWGMLALKKEMPGDNKTLGEKASFLGKAYTLGAKAYEADEKAKAEITEINRKIYQMDDPLVSRLWQKGKNWSLCYFEEIYQRLATNRGLKPAFDRYYPESEAGPVGLKYVQEGLQKGIFEKSAGAVVFPGEKYGLHTRVFINSLGLPTYEAKELGLAPTKFKDFPYDLSIIVTANEIDEYFKVLLKALELLNPNLAAKTKHVSHGLVRLPEGKMASRTGKVISAAWLLDEAQRYARQKIEEANKQGIGKDVEAEATAEIVGVGAVKYALLRSALGKDIEFSFKESISFDGNCGPYLQYTYARARSVFRKAGEAFSVEGLVKELELDPGRLTLTPEEVSILRTLYKFPEVVEAAANSYAPHLVCNFLYDLAQKFNAFYNNVPILGAKLSTLNSQLSTNFRLTLTAATAQVLENGLDLLGIEAPERM